jgi:hypothetical protein
MYQLQQPSMAVNDPRVASPDGKYVRRYQMQNSWDIGPSEMRLHIIGWVAVVARGMPGGKMRNLVLSCHGLPAYLQLGEGFDSSHLPLFDAWRGLIEKIWFPDCLVARIPDPTMQAELNKTYPALRTGDGNVFCSDLAKRVQCYVVAPTEIQTEAVVTVPFGMMTSFEGLVLSYGPQGDVTWSHRNPSTWIDKSGLPHGVPD